MKDSALAQKLKDHYLKNPFDTITVTAKKLKVDEEQVSRVLDSYSVNNKGKINHRGPGQGGGWVITEV